jgi:hypothetical protein
MRIPLSGPDITQAEIEAVIGFRRVNSMKFAVRCAIST